ncbi:hypothetical protein Lser_V15G22320 [Lactuca serriola]
MECNKDEAIRAKNISENKMKNNDFEGARKFALKAQKLFPELDNISQIITVCDVHCSSQKKINNSQKDLYGILQVENIADEATIKKQYRKLALILHPDKNKFPGAESAFKLICEANMTLSAKEKRCLYDFKCKESANPEIQKPQSQKSKSDTNGQKSTFWVNCPFCLIKYEYDQAFFTKQIRCPKCFRLIMGFDGGPQHQRSTDGSTGVGGSNQRSDTGQPVKQEVEKTSKRTRVVDEKSPGKKSKVSSSKIEEKNDDVEAMYIDCKDPEFTNFDKEKQKECFEVDQIWACYDPIDGMPRFYAQIRKVFKSGFRVRITWLEADPDNPPEIKWAEEGLPVACGKFIRGETEETQDSLMFSHRIAFSHGKKRFSYFIYPKKGEIWALFKDWDINWSSDPKSHMKYRFEIVEILSDFENENNSGVVVASMVKVKGFVGLFQRTSPLQLVGRKIPPNELFRFSHRVPSVKLTGTERADVPVGAFELDTASLPDDLNEFYTEPPKNTEFTCFHDFESDRRSWKFREGEIWAIRKPEDQNRKCYAQIKKIESSLHVDLLELCTSNDMTRPNACGLYKASNGGRRIISRDSFLFFVKAELNGRNRFNIYPNEKEIWVLYNKHDEDSTCTFADVEGESEVVEVVERNGDMIKVICLSRVSGYKSVFRASEVEKSKSRVLEIPCGEFNRFCYRVPAFLLTDEEDGKLRGCWELDVSCVSGTSVAFW